MTLAAALLAFGPFQTPVVDSAATDAMNWTRTGSVQTERANGGYAFRWTSGPDDQPWTHNTGFGLTIPIVKGDTLDLQFEARSLTGARMTPLFEMAAAPNTKYATFPVTLNPNWTRFRFASRIPVDLPVGAGKFTIFLGYGSGSMELRGLQVRNLGPIDPATIPQSTQFYVKPQPDARFWRYAKERIDRLRKAPLTVSVLDAKGRPITGAKIQVTQLAHAFRFGTAAPADRILGTGADNDRFRETLKRLFNSVTLENDLKWPATIRSYEPADRAIEWLVANGFSVRGHNVVWGSERWMPPEIWKLPNDELRAAVIKRSQDIVARYRGKVYAWDVVNEAATETTLWDRIGWDVFPQVFKEARRADPDVLLTYNDYNITEEAQSGDRQLRVVKDHLQKLIDANAPFDTIGIQAHVGVPMTTADRVDAILTDLAKQFGKRLEITEYDLGVQNDEEHARHMRDFLTVCFANPSVDGFVMWGFWQGSHWRANEGGAMFRRDWSERPTVKAYEDLVKRDWWTQESRTSGRNPVALRVFKGRMRVDVEYQGRKAAMTLDVTAPTAAKIVL